MNVRTTANLCLIALALCTALAWADAGWQTAGTVKVNSKKIDAPFLKQERRLVFPLLPIVEALGLHATADVAAQTVTLRGKTEKVASLVLVNGVAYVNWRDLSKLVPELDYGVQGTEAVFAVGATRPASSTSTASAGKTSTGKTGGQAGRVLTVSGKCSMEGADAAGLFTDGSATAPYKSVDLAADGSYSIDIQIPGDLKLYEGNYITDLRFYRKGAYESCHSCCNFILFDPRLKKMAFSVYGGKTEEISGSSYRYDYAP